MPPRPPLLIERLIALLWAVTDGLRARFERLMLAPLLEGRPMPRRGFLKLMERMLADDARLRRRIFETAVGMLGRRPPRLPLAAFALPRPGPPFAAVRRWRDYARMLGDPEWYARRLAHRLKRMLEQDPLFRLAGGSLRPPLVEDRRPQSDSVPGLRPSSRADGGGGQRAPPLALLISPIASPT